MPSGSYGSLVFQKADIAKEAITKEAKLKISRLYTEWANDIGKKAEFYKNKTTKSSWLQEMNMRQLQGQLQEQSLQVANEVKGIVEDSIYKVADSVVQANSSWLKDLGFPANGVDSAFVSIPDQTVRRLVTGQIYDTGWSLSKSIWGDSEKTLSKLYEIVAQGLAQNMSVYDVSKILEAYVSPNRAKQWNLMMPDGKRIYKRSVDYNAQRLARTLAQHGYQTSFIAVTEKNPFVTDYIWRANGSRVCELCMQRDGMHFKKDELPLDHPNGMCTMEPNVDDDKMIDQLADWINSPDGTYPEIDAFAKQFGYVPLVKESVKENQPANATPANAHHIVQGKDISKTWERRPDKFDFEIEDVINAQGFDGLPRVVSKAEFDKAVKAANGGKGFIAQRTYSAQDQETLNAYRDQLYHGKWYVDCSIGHASFGQGMYCTPEFGMEMSERGIQEQRVYADISKSRIEDNEVNRQIFDKYNESLSQALEKENIKDADIIEIIKAYDPIQGRYHDSEWNATKNVDWVRNYAGEHPEKYSEAKKAINNIVDKYDLENAYKTAQRESKKLASPHAVSRTETMTLDQNAKIGKYSILSKEMEGQSKFNDVGSYATSKGYDAIVVDVLDGEIEANQMLILNRTKVIFKKE